MISPSQSTLTAAPCGAPQHPSSRWRSNWTIALLALALAACFVSLPWERFAAGGFPDRDNYVATIEANVKEGKELLDFGQESVLAIVLNEYLWLQVSLLIGMYFEEPVNGLLFLSLVAVALVLFHVIREAGFVYGLALLLAPLTVDLFISQTRSALALAILLSALSVRKRAVRYGLFLIAFLIHAFAGILFLLYKFNAIVVAKANSSERSKLLLVVAVGLAGSIVWAFLAQLILNAVGDRRALQVAILPASIPFMLWWSVLTVLLVSFARLGSFHRDQHVMLGTALLAMFVFSTIFGAGALRFLSLGLPFVFIAIRSMGEPTLRVAAVIATMVFNLTHALYWMA